MSAENACPHCGATLTAGSRSNATGAGPPGEVAETSPIALLAPGSNDDNFVATRFGQRIAAAEPDPILGEFVAPPAFEKPVPRKAPATGSSPSFPSLDSAAPRPSPGKPEPDDEDEDFADGPDRGGSWATVLLASYASAITLALAWTLWQKPRDSVATLGPTPTAESRPAAGHQAELSRKVTPPEPILAEHLATLASPVVAGMLEVTPLEVRRQGVTLQRTSVTGKVERRDGGKGALALRLRLRNTSGDAVFAPLDQAYIRERDNQVVDSFIETAGGERVYPYPLAVESEWSVAGEDFAELRPGEARVVSIVSAPDAPGDASGPFTWRVRLRTGIGRTDVIGVRWPSPSAAPSK